tara:strand:+ start:492 stop:752 length:261 start_codon:yes stop_codon:yes gene_type:complete
MKNLEKTRRKEKIKKQLRKELKKANLKSKFVLKYFDFAYSVGKIIIGTSIKILVLLGLKNWLIKIHLKRTYPDAVKENYRFNMLNR